MAEKGGDEESLLANFAVPSRASSSYTIEPGRETLAGSRSSSSESLGSRRESTNSLFSRRPSGKVFTQFIHTCFFFLVFIFIYVLVLVSVSFSWILLLLFLFYLLFTIY
jgi:hypothetical protein